MIVADAVSPSNAIVQKKATETINATNVKLAKLQRIYNFTIDLKI